jgi:hypothetical protein
MRRKRPMLPRGTTFVYMVKKCHGSSLNSCYSLKIRVRECQHLGLLSRWDGQAS